MALFVYMYSKSEDRQYCRIHTESSLKRSHHVRYLLPILKLPARRSGERPVSENER